MPLDLYVLGIIETLYGLLDQSPTAVLLLDEHKRLVYANSHAGILHSRRDGISLSGRGISLTRKQDDARLQGLIAGAPSTIGSLGSAMRLPRPPGNRPYGIFVAAVSRRSSASPQLRPAVCIVITDPDADPPLPLDHLQEIFGLTESEGRLAALLAAGEDLKCAARKLGITYGTARARLAEIFQKTETRRQGELINLLLTSVARV